jgi:hypothetical protein
MKALGLARQGKLKSAQQFLAPGDAPPANPVELHALAALTTHEGNYLRALQLWRLLQQQQPSHPEARRMIPMIELWIGRPSWHRYVPLGLIVLGTIIVGVFAIWAMSSPPPPKPRPPVKATPAPVVAPPPAAPSKTAPRPR